MGQRQGKAEIKIHREIITKLRWLPIRGSAFNNTSNSGPSALNLNNPRSNSNDNIGFRSALPPMSRSLAVTTVRTAQTGLKGLFSVPVYRKKIELP